MNPVLPLNEYVPDVEAHVFGDRVYLYGSHDRADSERFCVQDYTVWSASVSDLTRWTCHGVTYRKDQDPHSINGKPVDFYAPDCVQGPDGRFYLYYVAMGPNTKGFGPISVAVSDCPEGPFDYLGDVRYPDGTAVKKYLNNDPTVLNDGGRIYLYYGWGLGRDFRNPLMRPVYDLVLSKLSGRPMAEIQSTEPCILSCAFAELEQDMLTVREGPKAVLDSKTTASRESALYRHAFYEAPSIRRIGELYYLVYSSGENNELAYATSRYPDHGFEYRGVIISNSDLGFEGNKNPKNNSSTIHGSIERIDGQDYVFYHRCTNNTDYSRQVCAERIRICEDGSIDQVRMTSSGIEETIPAKGSLSPGLCCNLVTPKKISMGIGKQQSMPRIAEKDGKLVLADLKAGTEAVYRYLDLSGTEQLTVKHTGDAKILVNGVPADKEGRVRVSGGIHEILSLKVEEGNCTITELEFT